jgi:SsrA-binding protein
MLSFPPSGSMPYKCLMAKADKKSSTKSTQPQERIVSENRKARHRFEVLDTLECGIQLTGSEVKSLRDGKLSLDEAYARVKEGTAWLVGADIAEYPQATLWNHAPKRPRKLLMHREELRKFAAKAHEKGLTLVPLKVYFNPRGIAKVLLGLCRGKKLHDKRETLKKADSEREMARAMRRKG